MTDKELKMLCPECGEEGLLPYYESINVTQEPDLKNAVLDAGLFTWTCPVCGRASRVSYPFLYHDMAHRLMIHYLPDASQDDGLADAVSASGVFRGSGYTLRTVRSYEQLLEKICIFDLELDDRVVELCKDLLIRELAQEHPELDIRRALIDERSDQIYVAFVDADEDVFAIELPDDLYNRVYDLVCDNLDVLSPGSFAVIDAAWAKDVLAGSRL